MQPSPDISIRKCTIGVEKAPLLVIDNFVDRPDELTRWAVTKNFVPAGRYFPGVRAKAPRFYQRFVIEQLQETLLEFFELKGTSLKFSMCHYSLVTTPPEKLGVLQCIPHIDSADENELASIHYLFRKSYGGTAFYRHRQTGFEYVDASRKATYFKTLQQECDGPRKPEQGYINGDTTLFERIAGQDGVFNRILFYRQNSLHSGSIDKSFVPDPDPRTGRLSINSFLTTGSR